MRLTSILRHLSILTALLLLSPGTSLCDEPEVFSGQAERQLTIDNGLSQNTVTAMLQDSLGFIWLGTLEGLNRYDGYHCRVFRPEPGNPGSLSGIRINALLEDSRGTIWVGTTGGGLNRFDRSTESFSFFLPNLEDFQGGGNTVTCLAEDRAGRLWVGTRGGGLLRFDSDAGTFDRLGIGELAGARMLSLLTGRDGTIWAGTQDKGLWSIDEDEEGSRSFYHESSNSSGIGGNRVNALAEAADGAILVGTGLEGINRIDPRTGQVSRTVLWDQQDSITNAAQITALAVAPDGAIWIGSNGHFLARLQGRDLSWFVLSRTVEGKSGTGIKSLLFDQAGTLWVGTNGYGVDVITPQARNFETVGQLARGKLPFSSVRAIHTDVHGSLWFGGYGGLARLDTAPGASPALVSGKGAGRQLDQHEKLVNGNVMVIYDHPQDPTGTLWIGSEGEGLYRYDRQRDRFRQMPLAAVPGEPGIVGTRVYALHFRPPEMLYVGTDMGLNCINLDDSSYHFFDPGDPACRGLASGRVNALLTASDGRLWIGTNQGGISVFDPGSRTFTAYSSDPRRTAGLSGNSIYHFHQDDAGDIWVGTGAGLNRFDSRSGTFSAYHSADGLPGDTVYSILPDDRGCLWLSTNRGLSCLDTARGTFRNYSAEDGLQGNEFNSGARHRSPEGVLYFGGIEGLTRFDPGELVANRFIPPVVITGLSINNRPVPVGLPFDDRVILEAAVSDTQEVVLSHRDAVVSFEFAALNYINPARNEYAIKMEGFDRDWRYIGNRRFALYTNLSPGRYTFRVRGSNNEGLWNETGVSLAVVVVPPFWTTWWFRLLALLMFAGGIIGAVQVRLRMLKRQKEILEQTVSQRTDDLRRSEARIVSVMESLPFDLFVLDADGRYLLQNANCRRHWGELTGRRAGAGEETTLLDELDPLARERALGGETVESVLNRKVVGRERHFHHIMAPITDRGKGIGALGVLIDVTERVAAEDRRRHLEERVQEAQRLESLSVLAGGVAHDFNNLLTAIIGSTELARMSLAGDHQVNTNLKEIEQAAGQAADLCRQMLAYSGHGRFIVGPVDLDETLCGMEELLHALPPHKTPLELVLSRNLPAVEADVSQIQQVILNLVTNAAEASGEQDGPIRISTALEHCSRERLDRFVLGEDLPEGRFVRLQVADQGSGMERSTKEKVFEPFYSTKFIGRGLGLAAVLGIVRGHGGAIHLESEAGKGSLFTVLFPALENSAEMPAGKPGPSAEDEWQGSGQLLLADDEEQVRTVGRALLRRLGYTVLTATDGQEAVDLYREHGAELAGVILDLTMPKMGGERALAEILELDPGARVILASGYIEEELAEQYAGAGLTGFLQKPFRLATLRETLRQALS